MTRWPVLTPNKPERLVVHCSFCYAPLAVGKYGKVAVCEACAKGKGK